MCYIKRHLYKDIILRTSGCVYTETDFFEPQIFSKKIKKSHSHKAVFRKFPVQLDTLEITENDVVPMPGLVPQVYSLNADEEEEEHLQGASKRIQTCPRRAVSFRYVCSQ